MKVRAGIVAVVVVALAADAHAQSTTIKRCIGAAERGQEMRKGGQLLDAEGAFRECSALDCPATVRRDCSRWIEELEESIPSYVVRLVDEDKKEVTGGRVTVDGHAINASGGRALQVDPGPHKFVWVRKDAPNVEQELVVREGERNRVILLAAGTKSPPPDDDKKPPPGPATPTPQSTTVPWIIGGAGVASIAVGGIFWGIGLSERSDLSSTCASSHSCLQHDVDASKSKLVVGDVLVGLGLVAVAGAAYFLFFRSGDPPQSQP